MTSEVKDLYFEGLNVLICAVKTYLVEFTVSLQVSCVGSISLASFEM